MKHAIILIIIFLSVKTFAQPNTEVHLVDIIKVDGKITLSNLRNISNNQGYDNQPSFYDDNTILFSSTRNGQTDIAKYNIEADSTSWVTNTTEGSEYSPLRIPNSDNISAVRLDTTGLQRLYLYDLKNGKSAPLIEDLKIGYHVWDTDQQLVTTVLVKDGMNLMLNYLPESKNNTIDESIGRSLHKIPNSNLISFIHLKNGIGIVSSYDPASGEIKKLVNMPSYAQDMCWTNDSAILIPNDNTIMYNYLDDEKSGVLHEFKEKEITNITRMAVSPNGKHLVLVSDESPQTIIDKQVETFNAKNLNGFVSCFSDSIEVRNFPSKILYSGRGKMKENYGQHMAIHPDTQVEVVKRIVLNNIIIDEEIVREDGVEYHQAAIYELDRGEIKSMTFIHENVISNTAEAIVDQQLEAYNLRGLSKFLTYHSDDVEGYTFPNSLEFKGKVAMQDEYSDFFEKTLNLNCEIKNRIVVGNTVIDEESITLGKSKFRAIAIYQVVNDLIKKVTFIR